MTLADSIAAAFAAEQAAAIQRIRIQAANRAAANDADPIAAANLAEELFVPGCCHETIVSRVSGQFRRAAA